MRKTITLPPPIRTHVGRYVRLRRRHALVRSAGFALAFFLAWTLGCCMLDRALALLPAVRFGLLAVGVATVVAIVFRPLAYWLSREVNWRAAAADIERQDADLAQRLQTVTSATLEPDRLRASPEI
ncbi:MAG: hypothetical protein WBD40_16885, partial [Tepidisphaeraceae bacterium]